MKDDDSDLDLDGLDSGDEGGHIPKTAARYDGSLEGVVALTDCTDDANKMTCQVSSVSIQLMACVVARFVALLTDPL